MWRGPPAGEVRRRGAEARHARTTAPTCGLSAARSCPNIGLNAVAGPPARGVRHRSHRVLRHASRLLRHRRAHPRHERQRRARFAVLPVDSRQFCGQLWARVEDKDLAKALLAGLQRLAHRLVVWRATRAGSSRCRCPRCGTRTRWRRRSTASPKKGCHAVTFSENPEKLGYPSFHSASTGIRSGRRAATRARSCACTSARRRSW